MLHTGQVKWFDVKKGWGFIHGPEGQDVFVHYSQITGDGFKTLRDGEMVNYELTQGDKGFQARTVERVDGEDDPANDGELAHDGYDGSSLRHDRHTQHDADESASNDSTVGSPSTGYRNRF